MEAVISKPFTFQVLFVDFMNNPVAVDNPTISIFTFSLAGVKQVLVAAAMNPAAPVEVGRYTYTYTIPASFTDGDSLYGEMTGEEPGSGVLSRVEQPLTLISANRGSGGGYTGLIARFVKGG